MMISTSTREGIQSFRFVTGTSIYGSLLDQSKRVTPPSMPQEITNRYMIVGHKAGTAVWNPVCGGIDTKNMMVGTVVGNNILTLAYRAPEAACLNGSCKSHIFDQNLPIAENILK